MRLVSLGLLGFVAGQSSVDMFESALVGVQSPVSSMWKIPVMAPVMSPVTNPGNVGCDLVYDCWSCLQHAGCLWDPNTAGGGSCKPKEQCDFTVAPRAMMMSIRVPATAPSTACVATVDRCSQTNFNGAPLISNGQRGVGCTNHGQCASGQYCYSCSKCLLNGGNCGQCNLGSTSVSGMCSDAWRCPIDNDSISGTCPGSTIGGGGGGWPAPIPSCGYSTCASCAAAYGCVWSGSYCYYATSPCVGYGCANTPADCPSPFVPRIPTASCSNYYECRSCAAANGCVWSGSYCYYTTVPCSNWGCANDPTQCTGGSWPSPVNVGCISDRSCDFGQRCINGVCIGGVTPQPIGCNGYYDCVTCLSNPNCLWDPNAVSGNCKPSSQCDFTFRALRVPMAYSASISAPPSTACYKTIDRCWAGNANGEVIDRNPNRGAGCTTHGQCGYGQYCFSCSLCRGDCSVCWQGISVSGACGPSWRCSIDRDSIDGACPP